MSSRFCTITIPRFWDCLADVNRYSKYPVAPEDVPSWLPTRHPTQEVRSLWCILIPKVVVYPDGTLVFHIIDGAEIPFVRQQTSPLHRKPLSPEKWVAVVEAYSNGVTSSILAERYECSSDTTRAIARQAQKSIL